MEHDRALRAGGHRLSLVSNRLADTAIARLRILQAYGIVFGKNETRNEVSGHIRARIERQTSSRVGF